jgi:hypothetical protein
VPASQFEAVDESSLMIDPNSAAARSCGGAAAIGSPTPSIARAWMRVAPLRCGGPSRVYRPWSSLPVTTAAPRRLTRWSGR